MKYSRVLKNNNQILSEAVKQAYYPEHISNFSIKMVFSGNSSYNIGKRHLNLFPDSFLALNQGTYSSKVDSNIPVNTLSISFAPEFLNDFYGTQNKSMTTLLEDPFNHNNQSENFFLETIYPFAGDMKYNILHLKNHIEQDFSNDLLINEYLHHCLINFFKIYHKEVSNKSENLNFLNKSTKFEILKRLTFAKEYISSNYNKTSIWKILRRLPAYL